MSDRDALDRQIASLEEDTKEGLREFFESLQSDLDGARSAQRNAEKAAAEAEKAAAEAEDNFHAALALQNDQYARVIQEIFEKPKYDLIRRISRYSLGGILVTLTAAVVSIALTPIFLIDNTTSNLREIINVKRDIGEVQVKLDDLYVQVGVSDDEVLQIVRHLEKNKEDFGGYQRWDDLERMYKVRPFKSQRNSSGYYYHQYRIAFRVFGLDDIPSYTELQRWDFEAHRLYQSWHSSVKDRRGRIPSDHAARNWDSFKLDEDNVTYRWMYSDSNLTFSKAGEYAMQNRDFFSRQWNRNKSLML